MLLLTGCQSIEEIKDADQSAHRIGLSSQIEETVTHTDDEWIQLQEALNQLEKEKEWWYYANDFNSRYITEVGAAFADGMLWIEDIDTQQGKKAIEIIEEKLGSEFETFMNSADTLQVMETGGVTETIIDTYGVVLQKIKNSDYEQANLYLCKSSLMLKDQKEQEWLQEVCGEDVLLSAVSQGAEKYLIGLSTPSYLMKDNVYRLQNISAYYHLFKESNGDIRQIKMVLKQGAEAENKMPENQAIVLKKLISRASGEEVEISSLIDDIDLKLANKGNGVNKGVVGKLSYRITKERDTFNQADMIVVELDKSI